MEAHKTKLENCLSKENFPEFKPALFFSCFVNGDLSKSETCKIKKVYLKSEKERFKLDISFQW